MQKTLRFVLGLMVVTGCVLMVWPLGQTAYGRWNQSQLRADWQKEKDAARSTPPVKTHTPAVAKPKAQKPQNTPWPSTRLIIPEIGVDTVVLQGWDEATLRRAPGHAPNTSPPGQGNCAIAAHRNVYGAWFRRLDELLPGSVIQLQTPQETFTYRVAMAYGITDTDTTVLEPPKKADAPARLTLVTCTLPRSSARLVTVAVRE